MTELVHVETSWRSLNKYSEELCGDNVRIRRNEKGAYMVLADGLGSGVKANILSTLTSTILSEMMVEGMSLQDAVETIAETLPVCDDRGIAYSTFTIIFVSYETAEVYIAQYDCPTVVIIREHDIYHPDEEVVEVAGKDVHIFNFKAEIGDDIVVFSDGILHAGLGMLLNFGWDQPQIEEFLRDHVTPNDDASEVTRLLLSNTNYLYGGKPGDDSTVACMRIIEPKETRIMIGPPTNKDDDKRVVDLLQQATGYKICCGGTTGIVVARELGQELETDMDFSHLTDIPPKGFIKGMDLVTEGVLTLQKVSRVLSKALHDPEQLETLKMSKEKDGASCLIRYMLNSSSIRFMVGMSDNPAYSDIAYSPVSLEIKVNLVHEIGSMLKELGKIVHIDTY